MDYNGNVTLTGTITVDGWTAPTLLNSWANTGGVYSSAGYMKDKMGFVHLRGVVKNGSSTIFTLPAGYRPSNTQHFIVKDWTGSIVEIGEVDIDSSGNVSIGDGSNNEFHLEGTSFLVGQ